MQKLRNYCRIRDFIKTHIASDAERSLVNSVSLDVGRCGEFLATRAWATTVLKNPYVDYQTNNGTNHFALHRKLNLSKAQ
jgi:hypothetical protein